MVKKFNAIKTTDTTNLVKEIEYNKKINEIEKAFLFMIIVISILLHKNLIS